MVKPVALLAALALAIPPAQAAPDLERQKELLEFLRQDCGACHGMTLKGGLGSPLLPGNLTGYDPQGLAEIILNGKLGTPMPPWKDLLTQDEAEWLAQGLVRGAFP
ncbi:MAG: cytochrome c [Rhodospirillales bacterium]|jgi:cytochrome c55X|nr:cytochrome c [Rhodospirillales bacterium]MDK9723046.1 cytochrome c [Rhodospirillales bacterium]